MITEELVRNIVQSRFEIFDTELVEQAKNRIIDAIGCAIGGANAPGNSMIRDLLREWGGSKEATILVHGVKAPAHDAAWVNSIMTRSFDYGAVIPFIADKPVPAHVSETTVPTAITMAEWKHAGGKELITALILGDDITTRLSAASDYVPSLGWDSPGTVNKYGATAIAGKLLGLNERQMLNAFCIILHQLAGSFQGINDGAHTFKLAQSLSARDGIVAAELASKGFFGGKDPLLGKYGYFSLYCQGCNPEALTKDLGKEFYADKFFKAYPSCGFTHAPIDCALNLVREHDIKTEEIDEVTVNVSPFHVDGPLGQPFEIGDFPQGNALFSFRYTVASALVRKNVKLEYLTEEFIRDSKVVDLIKRVNVIGALPADKVWGAEVTVRMKDGQEFSSHVDAAKGNPIVRALTKEEIVEKFWGNVTFSKTVSKQNAEAALDMINNLEQVDDITRLVQLLVA